MAAKSNITTRPQVTDAAASKLTDSIDTLHDGITFLRALEMAVEGSRTIEDAE
jgi:hypothetical protein